MKKSLALILIMLTVFMAIPSFGADEYGWVLVDTYTYPIPSSFSAFKDFDGTAKYYAEVTGNTILMRGYNPDTFFKQVMDLHAKYSWTSPPKVIPAKGTVTIRMYQEMYNNLDGNLSVGLQPNVHGDVADLNLGTATASKVIATGKYNDGTDITKMYLGYGGNANFQKTTYVDLNLPFYDAMSIGTKRAIYVTVYGGSPGTVGTRYTYEYRLVTAADKLVQYGATAFPAGVRLQWQAAQGLGYRVFRSAVQGELGISVSDFYIEDTTFFDVNVSPSKTYYYTVKPVITEANPLSGVDEVLGAPIGYYTVATSAEVPAGAAQKSVIVLQLGNKMMNVNGESKEIDPGRGTVPMIIGGRTMIPITAMIQEMGGTVGWDGATRKVTINARGKVLEMWLDNKTIKVGGANVEMDVAPVAKNGRTYVPVSFVANNLNAKVSWLNSTKEAIVIYE